MTTACPRVARVFNPCCLVFLLLVAAAPATRPTTLIQPAGCVTPDCHPTIKSHLVTHGPIAVDACDICHEPVSIEKHTYKPRRDKADLCTYCHDFDPAAWQSPHKPVTTGDCIGCHNPHGGPTRAYLKDASTADLCARCHDPASMDRPYQHYPVHKGACDTCHPAHGARYPKLLDVAGSDLCLACHVEFDARIGQAKHRHKAMDKGCTQCHEVHASDLPLGVKQQPAEMCVSCHEHEKVRDVALASEFKHSVVLADRACLSCHTPHGGDFPKLMGDLTARTCLRCHNEPVKTERGHVVPAVNEVADPKLYKHGPIKEGQCGGCHAVHGSDRPMLLAKAVSKRLYQDFSLEQYELCFSCHDVRLGELETVDAGITAFRNGDKNLHYLHLRADKRDKNCAFCHADHVTAGPRLVRDKVPFGKWPMPINYRKTDTGGSCLPGCHIAYAYDRQQAVPLPKPTTRPTTRDVPLLAIRPEPEKPRHVRWSAVATDGSPVTVPAMDRPIVLAFVGSDPSVLERVTAAVHGAAAQVVVVQCGDQAASPPTAAWPVVADPSGRLIEQTQVRGWPTVVVVRAEDGLEVARFSDPGESLAIKLRGYLDLAAGRIDEATLEQNLAVRQVISDDPKKLTPRRILVADRFLADGKPEGAITVLEEALRLDPGSAALKSRMIDALLSAKRPKPALQQLNALKPDEIPAADRAIFRARAFVMMKQWYDAEIALKEAARLSPDSPDVHHLAGVLAETDGNFRKATEEYRKASELRRR